ncbi:MAG: hypothetical protein NVSMB68_03560 [Thermoanaerobaculia bacterium]
MLAVRNGLGAEELEVFEGALAVVGPTAGVALRCPVELHAQSAIVRRVVKRRIGKLQRNRRIGHFFASVQA